MPVAIQNTDIRATIDQLEPDPPNTNLPSLDERTLVWTLPTDLSFLLIQPLFWRIPTTTINATNLLVQDDGATVALTMDQGEIPNLASNGRYYQNIQVTLAGGVVNPIEVQVSLTVTNAAGAVSGYVQATPLVQNPGRLTIGPFYATPGIGLSVANNTQGGAADTMAVRANGFVHQRGTPVPIIPSPALNLVTL